MTEPLEQSNESSGTNVHLLRPGISSKAFTGEEETPDAFGTTQSETTTVRGEGVEEKDMSDLTNYRLEQVEKRYDKLDTRIQGIEEILSNIQVTLGGIATKGDMRNWGFALIAIIIASAIGLVALLLTSSSNQLSAFQAGLSAVQTKIAVQPLIPSQPDLITRPKP